MRRILVACLVLMIGLVADVAGAGAGDLFLHSTTNDFLNATAPTSSTAKFKDSAALDRTTYRDIGAWAAATTTTATRLTSLSALHVWIGLKNTDDQGTYFDVRAELRKNDAVIASGETKTIQGVVRNEASAKEVTVTFGAVSDTQLNPGDVLSVRIRAKVADSGGHATALGVRLYYDATNRAAAFGAVLETDSTPPTIVATATPAPNAAGWRRTNVTVSFACSDSGSGVASCPPPVTVTTEGANQVISGTATDRAGNSATASVTVNLDKTAPAVTIASPATGATLGASPAAIAGSVSETLSGLATVTCNGITATLSGAEFACSVPLTDGPNTVAVVATDVAGNTGSATLSLSLQPAPVITITSPAPGSVINAAVLLVRGTVVAAPGVAVGVNVNGVPASINDTLWAAEIQLKTGAQTIEALAVTARSQATARVSVDVASLEAPLLVRAAPAGGVTPLTVTWEAFNQTDRPLVLFELDENGSGTFGAGTTTFDGVETTYTQEGLRFPVLRATDDQGTVYVATTIVNAESPQTVTARFRALWSSFKDRLQAGDIPGALEFLTPGLQQRMEPAFQQLGSALPGIFAGFGDLHVLSQSVDLAEAVVPEPSGGTNILHLIYFQRDLLGRWLIEEM
jgi:hypothetical protein